MRLTILGGGGFRVPQVYSALLADREPGRVDHVSLYDTDARRMTAVLAVCRELAADVADAPSISVHTDLAEAVRGTDFVFSAIRVGGLEGRSCDERLPLAHGLLGQETVGAGGLAYGMRTIPVTRAIGDVVRREAPDAWFISFTNPAGIVTETLVPVLGERVVGICDSPVGLVRRAARAAGAPDAVADYVGINHLGWLQHLDADGTDVLPALLADAAALESFEEGRLFGAAWLQAQGCLPNEYLHHYDFAREDVAAERAAQQSRAQVIMAQQEPFFAAPDVAAPGAWRRWEDARLAREQTYLATAREANGAFERDPEDLASGGYDRVALAIMHAIAHDRPARLVLNTPNRGRVRVLDDDAVVEAPCRVDATGVHAEPVSDVPTHGEGLVVGVRQAERLAAQATLEGSRRKAWLALAAHPLVDSANVARRLLDDMLAATPGLGHLR